MKNDKVNLYKELYEKNDDYLRNLIPMYRIINSCINFNFFSFLDYGCGQGNLAEIFKNKRKIKIYKFDPALEEYSYKSSTLKVDLIANCDVMEHIPENEINDILNDMFKISNKVFFNIYLKKAETILPNGENAHCTIKPKKWWLNKIKKIFPDANYVFSSYKNSICIITWKVSYFTKFTNLNIVFINLLETYISRFINFIFK